MTTRRSIRNVLTFSWLALLPAFSGTADATQTITNGIYEVHVESQSAGDPGQFGSWNAVTAAGHPLGAGRDITYRGGSTTTNFSSLRIFRSPLTDYVPGGLNGAMNLDPHLVAEGPTPAAIAGGGTGWRTEWQIDSEGLRIRQDLILIGSDVGDSAVYHTVEIENLSNPLVRIGWRNLHDWSLTGGTAGDQDNPANSLETSCGASVSNATRDEFSLRPVTAGLVRMTLPNDTADYAPRLSLGFDPGFLPNLPITVPDEYAYVAWRLASGSAFDYSIQGLTNLVDSAGLSWFGRRAALAPRLTAGKSVRFTQALFAFPGPECPEVPACKPVPYGLVGWWPFNEPDQGVSGRWDDVARGHLAVARFAPDSIDGKVGRALSFDGNLDEVVVQDAPDLDFPAGFDLSIDFWIRTDQASGVSTVLDKRTAAPAVRGYQVFLFNGEVGLQLSEGVGFNICSSDPTSACTNYVSEAFVADGQWHLVAVTVDRDNPTGGIWYLDGDEIGSRFDPTLRDGSLENGGQLLIGDRASDGTAPFRGDLDELEIFRRLLSTREIREIYEAGPSGKCTSSVDAPWDEPLCKEQNSLVSQISVCNYGGNTGRFVLDFAGLPAGGQCQVAGPTQFTLLGSSPLVIPPGQCRTARVRIVDPPALINGNASCFEVTATNVVTGQTATDPGYIPVDTTVCARTPFPVTALSPFADFDAVVFEIEDTGLGSPDLDVRVEVFENADGSPPAVRLADAAPGEAIERRVTFGADGIGQLTVPVALTEEATPLTFYDVVLSAELDGDPDPEYLASATVFASPDPCTEGLNGLCLNQERFRVEARWRTAEGDAGVAQAVPLTSDTGFFWFFGDANLELVVKVLDACNSPFDSFWVFAGGLTNVEVELTVTDLVTGASKSYFNPLNTPFQPILDTSAFPTCDAGGGAAFPDETAPTADKVLTELPLNDERFVVEVEWETPQGASGSGQGVPLTSDTGYFWFFGDNNVELVVKVLDACNTSFHRYWVFAAGLTDVEVQMTVTDTTTGDTRTYGNPQGNPFQPILDVGAFDTCP